MDHAKVAGEVVEAVGGASNISAAAHCATRLRLVIADESKINQQALDDNEDLKGTFAAGGMFQIIVGPGDVDQVYDHMVADHGVREVSKDEAKEEAEAGGNIFSRFVKMIADIFVPILPALIAGGLLMALHSVLTAKGLFGEQSVIQMFPVMTDYARSSTWCPPRPSPPCLCSSASPPPSASAATSTWVPRWAPPWCRPRCCPPIP